MQNVFNGCPVNPEKVEQCRAAIAADPAGFVRERIDVAADRLLDDLDNEPRVPDGFVDTDWDGMS